MFSFPNFRIIIQCHDFTASLQITVSILTPTLDCLSFFFFSFLFRMVILCAAAAAAKSLQSCPTLCDPTDGSPPGSPFPGILQARTLEWVAISFSNAWKWKVKVKLLRHVWLLATPWTAAYQAPPSMGFSRQEYWSGVPWPSPLIIEFCLFETNSKQTRPLKLEFFVLVFTKCIRRITCTHDHGFFPLISQQLTESNFCFNAYGNWYLIGHMHTIRSTRSFIIP